MGVCFFSSRLLSPLRNFFAALLYYYNLPKRCIYTYILKKRNTWISVLIHVSKEKAEH